VGSLLIILLQISNWVRQWKNYENRSIFSKDMDKSIVSPFFRLTVYNHVANNIITITAEHKDFRMYECPVSWV